MLTTSNHYGFKKYFNRSVYDSKSDEYRNLYLNQFQASQNKSPANVLVWQSETQYMAGIANSLGNIESENCKFLLPIRI